MSKNLSLRSINFIRESMKSAGSRRFPRARGVSYATAAAERNDIVEDVPSSRRFAFDDDRCTRGSDRHQREEEETRNVADGCEWVPHPRSGIYFPKGQDWVLEDVPRSAIASSGPTFWLRSGEGVDGSHIDAFDPPSN